MFNRFEILTAKYKKEILAWNWQEIKKKALCNVMVDDSENILGNCYLGTIFGIMPSGKFYAFWTTNQTRSDVTKDQCFMEALESVAYANDMFVGCNEFDSDGVFIQCKVESIDQAMAFVTDTDREKALELFANN